MMTAKDQTLISHLFAKTQDGSLRWEPTAQENQYSAPLRGEYTATIELRPGPEHDLLYLRNSRGELILELSGSEDVRINQLFQMARRNAYNVDKAIDEIIGEDASSPISDEDIPF